jgi:D-serine deaminase-like pyridoxal phosphate-dependent protein
MRHNREPEWYRIENVDEIDSPALVVYPDRVAANIRTALTVLGDASRLRPHADTHKSQEEAGCGGRLSVITAGRRAHQGSGT